ncbi:MAG: ABC transporter ATP-binding protein [Clostridium sp.]|nr:ABC transporter ATP-binding protein [Clostridium sp.]
MIQIKDLCLTFDNKAVLQNFSLTLPLTGITALSGPSGCGKTSLLRCIAGLEHPQSGEILGICPEETAFLFQEDRLLPWRTVSQQLTDVLPRERHGETARWLALAELTEEEASYPGQLSGGMSRRLALARTLALGGALYLLDEPFAGIDPERISRLMQALRKLDTPVLLSSHLPVVLAQADRVIRLDGPPLIIL